MRFVPLGPWVRFFPVKPESVVVPVVREDLSGTLSPGSGAGLFDIPDIPITLVGTSFSTGEVWDFAGAIRYSLQADLLNVGAEGVGPFIPMHRYLLSDTYREIAPSLVIWEIPERYLTLPETEVPELIPIP
jgi:alginate O-acetyltransferase complex protein AlgJ